MADRFDPAKNSVNQAKHGLPLSFGDEILKDESHLILPSIRPQDGEERFKVIGLVGDRLFTAVFVRRDDVLRFISVRRSNNAEERAYRFAG
ncbi:BrnT family toxin [Acidisoma cellulosilytica]|uniref:BrnT family toxin n=1 Tax=Acidisoma cellulosilyticum TaxID=2802395 RepID=A0A964E681_9PROT|nr:BrnT family toxin [Acidisoma cellulosilyticum]MCB8883319.1 BrnT family toxin [Acidisoma cellulosilyticum]